MEVVNNINVAKDGIWYGKKTVTIESGTWTPSITGNTGGVAEYISQEGQYTLIGNVVLCTFNIYGTFTTEASGVVRIYGLPFTVSGTGAFPNQVLTDFMGSSLTGTSVVSYNGDNFLRMLATRNDGSLLELGFGQSSLQISNSQFRIQGQFYYTTE